MNTKAQILIVEDEGIVALDLQNRLRRLGYAVPEFVATGEEAVALAAEILPDLILMDIKLKGEMDGIEAANYIKENFDIPIIYLTAFADEVTLERAEHTHPYGYLLKPFEEHELLASIRMGLYRHQAESQVKESERKFRSVIEQSNDGILLVDDEGRIIEWNAAQEKMSGRLKEDVLHQFVWDVQAQMLPEHLNARFPVAATKKTTLNILQQGEVMEPYRFVEIEIELPDHSRRFIQSRLFVIKRENGHLLASINRDVTQQQQVDAAIRQAQKLESLGVLAGGTAHDLNNLLMVMLGQVSLALAKLEPDSPQRHHLHEVMKAAERAAELAENMLAFSGRGMFEIVPLDLNKLLWKMSRLPVSAVPEHVQLILELTETMPKIEADMEQMQQVLTKVISNAVEAIGKQPGTITISTNVIDLSMDAERFLQGTDHPILPGRYVLLTVQDDGCGMDADTQAKMFDPFFTTKEMGRGLGLAAVLGIVRSHGGGIQVESELGQGTQFKIVFMVIGEQDDVDVRETAVPTSPSPTGTHVLVIDDEKIVCEAVTDILDLEGIPVLQATDGQTGIDMYQQHQSDIGLVLLDLSMPGMDGYETWRGLRQVNPYVRVILSSGYDEKEVLHRFDEDSLLGFLKKPYKLNTLIDMVQQHLPADK
ncbi:MAG: response regulator [Chloroflexi bacterium]|nr:MAG: response regulator [Chloroflexota bacterium]